MTEEIYREIDEELKQEQWIKFLKKWGNWIIGGFLAIVALSFGITAWQKHQAEKQMKMTAQLVEAMSLIPEKGLSAADEAMTSFVKTYGIDGDFIATFYAAGLKVQEGDLPSALALYQGLAKSSSVPSLYQDLAVLQSGFVQMDSADPETLYQQLLPLIDKKSPWRFSAYELCALLMIKKGDHTKAFDLLQTLQTDEEAPAQMRARASYLSKML